LTARFNKMDSLWVMVFISSQIIFFYFIFNLSVIPKAPFVRKGAVISPKSSLFKEGLNRRFRFATLLSAVWPGIKALNGIVLTDVFRDGYSQW